MLEDEIVVSPVDVVSGAIVDEVSIEDTDDKLVHVTDEDGVVGIMLSSDVEVIDSGVVVVVGLVAENSVLDDAGMKLDVE